MKKEYEFYQDTQTLYHQDVLKQQHEGDFDILHKDVEYHWYIIIWNAPKFLNTSRKSEKFVSKMSEWSI